MTTEAEAIANMGAKPAVEDIEGAPGAQLVVTPPGWQPSLQDQETLLAAPRQARGYVAVHSAAGFTAAVEQRRDGKIGLYADEEKMQLVAVLNDDHGAKPGWRDHLVTLELRRTPEWKHWTAASGALLGQDAFAEHIESGLDELITPEPAVMLDLAQTFQATTAARFKSGKRLSSGATQFIYDEDIDATAGAAGQLAMPEEFELSVRPFFGAPKYAVRARFRFRLNQGNLTLGYALVRPDDIERAAFKAIVDIVEEDLEESPIDGRAPDRRR